MIAADWRSLADFYTRVFGCEFVPPERNYEGQDLSRGTAVADAALSGVHLRLPGHGETGPTIEIYQYRKSEPRSASVANRLGFAHIAFQVDDVPAAREAVLRAGGKPVGEIVTLTTATGGAGDLVLRHRSRRQHDRAPGLDLVAIQAIKNVEARGPRST